MKAVVFGSGFQGVACAWDLVRSPEVESVLLVDQNQDALEKAQRKINSPKIRIQQADITNETQAVELMKQGDVTVSAVPYFFNEKLTKAAIKAGSHFVDMGGNTDLVFKQMEYSEDAQGANVTIVPDMGLAPGYANLLAAELIEKFNTVDSVEVRVGGLPQNPPPPLDYQLFFSVEGLINEYIGACTVLKDGQRAKIKSLTELESLTFPEPVGACEAFHTLGGSSTLPWTYEGRVRNFNYKTVRYPGHCEKLVLLEDLGFFDTEPVRTRDGQTVEPRQVTGALFTKKLSHDEPRDYVVIRVTVKGSQNGQQVEESFECLDKYDEATQMTAMMRTTAFPVSIVAQLLGTGKITESGVFPPERVIPLGVVREEMAKRGIETKHSTKVLGTLVHS
jgi:lysine 6-dehydrogenase